MRDKLFKLLFKREYSDYKFCKREYEILTSSATRKQMLELLPYEVEGGQLDEASASYKRKGKMVFISSPISQRTKIQNLVELFMALEEQGYVK
jgi:hypothetical protein